MRTKIDPMHFKFKMAEDIKQLNSLCNFLKNQNNCNTNKITMNGILYYTAKEKKEIKTMLPTLQSVMEICKHRKAKFVKFSFPKY